MTYNVRSFYGPDGKSSVEEVVALIREQNPDVVCLQEFNGPARRQFRRFRCLCEEFENARFGAERDPPSGRCGSGHLEQIPDPAYGDAADSPSSSVWADLLVGDDTVRVFNNHLHSTAINADDNEYITEHRFLSDTAREVKFRSIVSRLRANSSAAGRAGGQYFRVVDPRDALRTPRVRRFQRYARVVCLPPHGRRPERCLQRVRVGLFAYLPGFFNTLRIDYVLFRAVAGDYLRSAAGRIFGPLSRGGAAQARILTPRRHAG